MFKIGDRVRRINRDNWQSMYGREVWRMRIGDEDVVTGFTVMDWPIVSSYPNQGQNPRNLELVEEKKVGIDLTKFEVGKFYKNTASNNIHECIWADDVAGLFRVVDKNQLPHVISHARRLHYEEFTPKKKFKRWVYVLDCTSPHGIGPVNVVVSQIKPDQANYEFSKIIAMREIELEEGEGI